VALVNIDRSLIGRKFPPVAVTVEEQGIRRFAAAIGEANPLYSDRNVAIARGYRSLPAPPTYIFCLKTAVAFPGDILKTVGIDEQSAMLLHAEQAFTYHAPICGGDHITFRECIADIYEKKSGALVFVITRTVATNQYGERVADITYTEAVRPHRS
jgi:acyl dehydratase